MAVAVEPLILEDVNAARVVFGERDQHLQALERIFGIEIFARGTDLTFKGKKESCKGARHVLSQLYVLVQQGYPLSMTDVDQATRILRKDPKRNLRDIFLDRITLSKRHKIISPKTITQKAYVEAIRKHDVVFAWGPAGTGKTYLAMSMAVAALAAHQVDRIILTRPAVEAGERLGFLPGNLEEKVNPYLRPLHDALADMMDLEQTRRLVENGTIEVAPLAYMRGRTLSHSFVILDEAQNTTPDQMKMFLTRLGFDSKAIITGDITQTDLLPRQTSGLVHAIGILQKIPPIAFVEFSADDVVRHPIVADIIAAYQKASTGKKRS